MTIEEIENIPENLDECAMELSSLDNFEQRSKIKICMIVARSRDIIIDPDPWMKWVMDHYPSYHSDKHVLHLRQVGGFLLRQRAGQSWACLSMLSFGKLLSLSRLGGNLDGFLENNDVLVMTRDEVILAVNTVLGEVPKKSGGKKEKPVCNPNELMWQPDMFEIIIHVSKWMDGDTSKAAADDRIDVWTPARSGLSLLDVAIKKFERGAKLEDKFYDALITTLEEDIAQLKAARK